MLKTMFWLNTRSLYENYTAPLVAMATVLEKKLNDISYETTEPILMKFPS